MKKLNMLKITGVLIVLLSISSCSEDPLKEIRNLANSKDIETKQEASEYYDLVIDTLVQAYSSQAVLNRDIGLKLMLKEQFRPAVRHFNLAKEIRGTDAWIYYRLGVCYANIFKYEKDRDALVLAKINYQTALNIKPDAKEFLYAYAQLLVFGTGEYDEAVGVLKKYLFELKVPDPNGYFLLGRAYYILENYEEAYRVYNDALQYKNELSDDELNSLNEFIETTGRILSNE